MKLIINGKQFEITTKLELVEFDYDGLLIMAEMLGLGIMTITYRCGEKTGCLAPGERIQFYSYECPTFNIQDTGNA